MKTLFGGRWGRTLVLASVMLVSSAGFGLAQAQSQVAADSKFLAQGFSKLPKDAAVAIFPADIELFSISAGGLLEPKADWTEAAVKQFGVAMQKSVGGAGLKLIPVSEAVADEFAEAIHLQAAVMQSIALHHAVGGAWALPTKEGRLNWTYDSSLNALADRANARYGLFVWVRDSYASSERKVAMAAVAILSLGRVVLHGGAQVVNAALVDMQTGQVLWFNRVARPTGDLREEAGANETVEALLTQFPVTR